MSSGSWPVLFLVAAAHSYLVWRRLLAYLRYFQQEGYEHLRFLRWLAVRSLADPALWLAVICAFVFATSPRLAVLLFV